MTHSALHKRSWEERGETAALRRRRRRQTGPDAWCIGPFFVWQGG